MLIELPLYCSCRKTKEFVQLFFLLLSPRVHLKCDRCKAFHCTLLAHTFKLIGELQPEGTFLYWPSDFDNIATALVN